MLSYLVTKVTSLRLRHRLKLGFTKDFSNNQDRKCWMKWCLIYEMLGCFYAHLVLEVEMRDLDIFFHISYLYIENFWLVWRIQNFYKKFQLFKIEYFVYQDDGY